MLKKLIFMLALVFTVQVSWAVASSYCMHETGIEAQHFGHHDHQHKADTDTPQSAKTKLGMCDSDCDFCHHSYANIVSVHISNFVLPIVNGVTDSPPSVYQSHIPEGLIKPNWRLQG